MSFLTGAPEASGVESVTLAEGAVNSNISCLTLFNFPAGMVTWSRTDGQPLPTSRFSVSSTGQLIIANVLRQDSGEYSCVVQNQYGMSSASGSISVNCKSVYSHCGKPINTVRVVFRMEKYGQKYIQ